MKKLLILGLLIAFACDKGEDPKAKNPCHGMTVSDASPVQFWPISCETWNESRPKGVHHYCFCHPWECADTITIPVNGANSAVLKIYDDADSLIDTVPFSCASDGCTASFVPSDLGICDQQVILTISETTSLAPLSEWEEEEGDWDLSGDPTISTEIPNTTGIIGHDVSLPAGHYKVHWSVFVTNPGIGVVNLLVEKDGLSVVDPVDVSAGNTSSGNLNGEGGYEGVFEFNTLEEADRVRISVGNFTADVKIFVILDVSILEGGETEVFKSDCLDIKTSQNESLLIDYTNVRNFAGIDYGDATPDPSFSIRIPAVFFEPRFPQEGEQTELSSGVVVPLNSETKEQRQLSTDRMPNYMHRKILLVLQHQSLYIDGEYWVKGEEVYEKKEPANKRDSFRMYTCWLTRQDFVVRNVL